MKIKKEHEPLVQKLFKMTVAGDEEKAMMRELINAYSDPKLIIVTCWTCPGPVQNLYRRLVKLFENYEVEDYETNDTIGQTNPEGDNQPSKKGRKPKSSSSDI